MHWAEVIADELKKTNTKQVLATGITPSGPIHIGNMREVLTTDAVYRSLIAKDVDASFIYIADDFDHLRKVYPYLPKSYEQYVGQPISEIPCPCGKHDSYADHYLFAFLDSLEEVGIKPEVYRASEMYQQGMYEDAIKTALDETPRIRKIIETISKRTLPKHWLPFNIRCEQCNRVTKTIPVLYEYPYVEYTCDCGFEGKADIRKGGVGKLPWRVDWPARWNILNVTFEPFGKDLGTTGGARETGEHIVKEIYDYPAPAYTMYEFILLKGKGAMHSSKGTALSAGEMLKMTPPEVLRYLIMNHQPNKHLTFDPGFGLLTLVDDYDQLERVYFDEEEEIKGMKDLDTVYELSQPTEIPTQIPIQIPYRHLVTIVQISNDWEEIQNMLQRSNQLPETITENDKKRLQQRIEHVCYWLDHFAPNAITFSVKKQLPDQPLTKEQQTVLRSFLEKATNLTWDPEIIHNTIYGIAENQRISPKVAFQSIYTVILGQKKGPRVGYFLSNLKKEFVINRFKEAVK